MAKEQQRYQAVERIAAGGMAEVFRAESASLEGFKKTVAIKRVLAHLAEQKQFIRMFLDEARLSAQLSHSNCVQVFDIGVGEGTYFIVMEYVDGSDLKKMMEYRAKVQRRIDVPVACLIGQQICEGLAYAHDLRDSQGQRLQIVHRDVSPPNVLITRFGEVKVVDFGLARATSQLERSEPGIIKGKFGYLSPEAASGEPIDYRTDIFAAGIILWEMLAGRRLFLGETDLGTVQQVQAARIPSLRSINPDVPADLEAVAFKALARQPKDRFQSAREFGLALTRVMFKMARPVSSWDLATLVEEVLSEKERESKGPRAPDKSSFIGTMIQDAIMRFTSLRDGEGSAPADKPGEKPLKMGITGGSMTRAEASGQLESAALKTRSTGSYAVGNLSALEENPDASANSRAGGAMAPRMGAARPTGAQGFASERLRRATMPVLLVLLVALAGAAGAYLGTAIQ